MTKYEPLSKFLDAVKTETWSASFSEIEAVLGFSLPKSAYTYPAWWGNDDNGHSHARSWLGAGWQTKNVDVAGQKVTLVRLPMKGTPSGQRIGSMKGTFWVDPSYDLTSPLGEDIEAEHGLLFRG